MPPVMVMVRVLCRLDCWWCRCFRWCVCCWWWFLVRVGGWRGCNALGVTWLLDGFLCWVDVGEGVSGVVLGAGVLVLPTTSPLFPDVSAGEGVVAFGLGVGGGAGVGVAVTGPVFGRGWLGVAGCGRSPLIAEGFMGGAGGVRSPAVLAFLVTPMVGVP